MNFCYNPETELLPTLHMKRFFLCLLFFISIALSSMANHISGGEMYYTLVSQSGNNYTYHVTLKLFRDGAGGGPPLSPSEIIVIYEKNTNVIVWNNTVARSSFTTLVLTSPGPCVVNPPQVVYDVSYYEFDVTLPASLHGYTITYARCCRVAGISNVSGSQTTGVTYTAEIPGNLLDPSAPANNSAHFLGIDTVVICAGYLFNYNFGAVDADGDMLVYRFCSGFTNTGGVMPNPPDPPPYLSLPYQPPYSGSSPMDIDVSINPNNGKISGFAPPAGIYVVTVCVDEYRNGELIATQRKDLQVKVADCDIATVTLEPNGYINCNDFTVSFNNLTPSSLINSYYWEFGDALTLADSSNFSNPSYTYPDTGVYTVKVVANRNEACSDSTTAKVRVFPGFFPAFTSSGICLNNPTQFTDQTTAVHGSVNFWRWNFGVVPLSNDTSRSQNPLYTYTTMGTYPVEFIVGTSKGCMDTISNSVTIIDKPPITLAFRDTLICNIDTIQLQASGSGVFTWTPNYNISNTNTSAPLVSPDITTSYKVDLNDNGCKNQDSIRVRVINIVNLSARTDTIICTGDQVQLNAITDGLQYSWSPSASLSNPNILNPIATPVSTTMYAITSRIGGCFATEDVNVTVVPYPFVDAGVDTMICFNTTAQLNGQQGGTSFSWSPGSSLSNTTILNPVANPGSTTQYILTVIDNVSGCPKPKRDSVVVRVLPPVNAFAGRDTSIIAGQPLQLKATGGITYAWSPPTGLNDPDLQGPVAVLDGNLPTIVYTVVVKDQAGCIDSASITVNVFKTGPDIFVPTGFTPNNDGRNDIFRPIYAGMSQVDFFRVYNRWGQLVYSTKINGAGWDGKLGGITQNSGSFVWMVQAIDFTGKVHFKKGTVVLIR